MNKSRLLITCMIATAVLTPACTFAWPKIALPTMPKLSLPTIHIPACIQNIPAHIYQLGAFIGPKLKENAAFLAQASSPYLHTLARNKFAILATLGAAGCLVYAIRMRTDAQWNRSRNKQLSAQTITDGECLQQNQTQIATLTRQSSSNAKELVVVRQKFAALTAQQAQSAATLQEAQRHLTEISSRLTNVNEQLLSARDMVCSPDAQGSIQQLIAGYGRLLQQYQALYKARFGSDAPALPGAEKFDTAIQAAQSRLSTALAGLSDTRKYTQDFIEALAQARTQQASIEAPQ